MSEEKFVFRCDICGDTYEHGPHRYEGHKLILYGDIFACDPCWKKNREGWTPHYEKIILAHLERSGLSTPKRNAKGLLPRD
jgi:hypothetical protein